MLFDKDAKESIQSELLLLPAEKQVTLLRGYLDFVIELYAKAINRTESERWMETYEKADKEKTYASIDHEVKYWGHWLAPLPTPRQLIAMPKADRARARATVIAKRTRMALYTELTSPSKLRKFNARNE